MKPSRVHQKCSDSSGPPQPPSGCSSTHSAATVFSTSTSRHLLLSSPPSQKGDLVSPPCSLTSWHLLPFLHLDRWRHTYMCVYMCLRGWREQRTQWGRQRTCRDSQLLGSTIGGVDLIIFDLIWAQGAGPQSRGSRFKMLIEVSCASTYTLLTPCRCDTRIELLVLIDWTAKNVNMIQISVSKSRLSVSQVQFSVTWHAGQVPTIFLHVRNKINKLERWKNCESKTC